MSNLHVTRAHFDMSVHPESVGKVRFSKSGKSDVPVFRTRVRRSPYSPVALAARVPHFSPVALSLALVATLTITYIALIAVVMSYAALTVSFSQSVRNTEASVAMLESEYLAAVSALADTDYAALGYGKPAAETYVPGARATALR